VSDEQFLTSPFMPRFHLFSHKLNFFEGALRAPLGPPGPVPLAPATPPLSVGLLYAHLQYSWKPLAVRAQLSQNRA